MDKHRRHFLQTVAQTSLGLGGMVLAGESALALPQQAPPPDLFDSQALDLEFWIKPRTLDLARPASGERLKLLYWRDGEIIPSAYEQLCHLLRDVNARQEIQIDPKLLETLWGTQAFIARFGVLEPLQILSADRKSVV